MRLQEVLLLKEQHLKEMAAVASVMAPAPASAAAHADEKAKSAAPLGEAHKSLLTQLEVLRNESRRMQETFMEERRLLVEESQSKLASQVCLSAYAIATHVVSASYSSCCRRRSCSRRRSWSCGSSGRRSRTGWRSCRTTSPRCRARATASPSSAAR
jgi:hypothetical protein